MLERLPGAGEVQSAVARVLARPEFARHGVSGPLAWLLDHWQALKAQVLDFLVGLLRRFEVLEHTAPVLYWLLIGWLVVSALAILAHLVSHAAKLRRGRARRPGRSAGGAGIAAEATDWAAAARSAAAAGRFREAALALYQGVLERLQQRGALRRDPAKTPGDYRREVRGDAPLALRFEAFLRGFEPVAFGGREPDRAAFERLARAAEEAAGG